MNRFETGLVEIAAKKVAALSNADIAVYISSPDKYLIADDMCSACDIFNSTHNVEHFENALDARVQMENNRGNLQ